MISPLGIAEAAPETTAMRIHYLDGLRGISILIVLLGHAFLLRREEMSFLLPFVDADLGVFIFFVISGFIISHFLFIEQDKNGRVNLKDFFLKRISKLIPTLLLFVSTVAVIQAIYGGGCPPSAFLAALTFSSSLVPSCWTLGHTWSLSIEEIFYLTWAPAFAFFGYLVPKIVLPLLFVLAPLARVLNHLHDIPKYHSLLHWYVPVPVLPHLDIILMGCLGALVLNKWRAPALEFCRAHSWLIGLSLAIIYVAALPTHQITALHFLGAFNLVLGPTLQALACTYLIVSFCLIPPRGPARAILCSSVLTYLGRISYSLYLWQQLVLVPGADATGVTPLGVIGRISLAIVIGSLSFHLFEEPIRKRLRQHWAL